MTEQSGETAAIPQVSKISIVGFAEGHLGQAPFGNPEWEVWGINRLHTVHEGPWHRWFNIHDLERFHGEDKEHLDFLKKFEGPVYLRPDDINKYPIPNQVPFPYEALVKRFGRYFNNTISWLIAFALMHDDLTDLMLAGVDMAMDSLIAGEYSHQKPSCEYFIGIAAGMGVRVHIPDGSDLLKTSHLYGLEDDEPMVQKYLSRLNELGQRKEKAKAQLAQMDGQRQQLINAINQMDGAMQDTQFWIRNWTSLRPGEPVVSESPNGQADSVDSEVKELIDANAPHID